MTVDDWAGEGQGPETKISVSLRQHSDSTLNREPLLQVPLSFPFEGKPRAVLGEGQEAMGERSGQAAELQGGWSGADLEDLGLLLVSAGFTALRSR